MKLISLKVNDQLLFYFKSTTIKFKRASTKLPGLKQNRDCFIMHAACDILVDNFSWLKVDQQNIFLATVLGAKLQRYDIPFQVIFLIFDYNTS